MPCWCVLWCVDVALSAACARQVGEGGPGAPDCVCGSCGSDEQTNAVRVTQPDGSVVPWIVVTGDREAQERARKQAAAMET